MTVEENIAWSELLKDTIVTSQHGNDGDRIVAATKTLQQAAHEFVKVLNERATLLANSAQFDTALRDAAAIRAILPGSGIGYLCMGDVHCQQGHHAAAIAIYDKGLQAVPESDLYYQQLQQHRVTAIANNSKRVDFISRLPLDIVITNIVPRMEPAYIRSNEQYEPLYVSRGWRKRILQCPHGLTFDVGQESETFVRGHDQLIRFAPYVQTLSGCIYEDVRMDDLFNRARFSNLKHLDLSGDDTSPRVPLINGLRLIADTLTHLEIQLYPDIQLRDVLETCPNLVSLDAKDVDFVMPSSPSLRYPKITHLAIHEMSERARSYVNMIDLLSRFPSLLSFVITPMPGSGLLTVLHKYFPYLQVLYFGERVYGEDNIDVRPNGRKGIVSAYLGGFEANINTYRHDDLVQFLHLNRNTLEELEFEGDIDDGNSFWKLENGKVIQQRDNQHSPLRSGDDDPTQTGTSFMKLGRIDFSGAEPDVCGSLITWLISNAPNLKATSLNQSYIQSNVANSMIQLKHLSKLEIHRTPTVDDFEGIIQFFQHHIEMGDQSALEEIVTYKISPGIAWMPLIPRLKRLKKLKFLVNAIHDNCIPLMDEMAQGCPALEKLILGLPEAELPDDVLKPWRRHQNLKCLKFGAESLTANDAITLCTFSNLKTLQLECDASDDLLEVLRNHIPKIELYPGP
ncbi:hypothetical protein O0I10_011649 [Lichtheimia ornata]|uniref:Uncharacterized protein n=1 Tax=Lichtheimia ornata TaxID=688661 RepID=A0AAD7USE0_9FUNG|nr:uncharacterized protein O0I10_011649 [Lichtheimia ornata]KAJ8652704.1 hypothetical protein O0I10_011649 [Lichtheimia ornata]